MRVVLGPVPAAEDDLLYVRRPPALARLRCQDELIGKVVVRLVQDPGPHVVVGVPVHGNALNKLGRLGVAQNLWSGRRT